jgi:hypothetical protein
MLPTLLCFSVMLAQNPDDNLLFRFLVSIAQASHRETSLIDRLLDLLHHSRLFHPELLLATLMALG